ncbi:MAG: hypothetical protein ACR2RF_14740 [Geminicoccaceae bacterium]
MAGVFVGTIELTDVGDIKIGGTDVQAVYVGGTKIWPPTGGGGFLPTDLANLEDWFDADDAGTITETGGEVSAWGNKGAQPDVAQGTAANQPNVDTLGGLNTIFFDASDALFSSGRTQTVSPQTTFGVVSASLVSATGYIISQDALDVYVRQTIDNVVVHHTDISGGDADMTVIDGLNPVDTPVAFIARVQDSTTAVIEMDDGTTETDAAVGTLQASISAFIIGSRTTTGVNGFNGHMMELGTYSQRLSDSDKDDLMNYLKTKWSL